MSGHDWSSDAVGEGSLVAIVLGPSLSVALSFNIPITLATFRGRLSLPPSRALQRTALARRR